MAAVETWPNPDSQGVQSQCTMLPGVLGPLTGCCATHRKRQRPQSVKCDSSQKKNQLQGSCDTGTKADGKSLSNFVAFFCLLV